MNCIRQIRNYGVGLILKDGIEFFGTKKSIKRFTLGEIVSRYIVYKSYYNRNPNDEEKFLDIKYNAFLPHPGTEVSVFRTFKISSILVWELGEAVARLRKKELIGRADLKVDEIIGMRPRETESKNKLDIKPDPLPFSHANIMNFPDFNNSKLNKGQQRFYALRLALKAGKLIKAG